MLYLAEVQKKGNFMGGGKAELKLLARQQSEQSWNAVPGEEMVQADVPNEYSHGNLVLVELSGNRQVQNLQTAGRQLVIILQNFSRMKEKFRTQEEEIEGWKQSLIYQAQELTRRELEMEARQEELQHLETEMQQYEQQHQELVQLRQQIEGDRQSIESSRQRLEELQASGVGVLPAEQLQQIEQLLNRLSQGMSSDGTSLVDQQQTLLNQHWQSLEQQQSIAQQQQGEIDQQSGDLDAAWQGWHQSQATLEQSRIALNVQESILQLKTATAEKLAEKVHTQETLQNQLKQMADGMLGNATSEIDYQSLMQMPVEELQTVVNSLRKDLEKMAGFVNDQEEELTLQRQAIDELQAKINQASEYDRLRLAADLDSERQSYQLLDETLQGQRQRLQERQNLLKAHEEMLQRRQDPYLKTTMDLGPVLQQLVQQHQQLKTELEQLQVEIDQSRMTLQQSQESVHRQAADLQNQQDQLKQRSADLQQRRVALAETWGRVNTYRETLQPLQDGLSRLRESIAGGGDANNAPQQTVDQLRQLIAGLRP